MAINNKTISGLQIALTVLLFVTTSVSAYVAKSVLSNQNRIIAIETNRFTVADGQVIWREFGEIRKEMNLLRIEVKEKPMDVPPSWFIKRIDRIENRLDSMEDYLKGARK
jgi:hypothetical protein